MSGEPRYSQPLPPSYRHSGEDGVVFAGFVDGEPGFILRRGRKKKEIQTEATRENSANERPRGFFASFARLMFGGRQ
jgi:hypothetical protein